VFRRRRTSRHRRNRRVRSVLLAVFFAGLVVGFAFVALQSSSLFRTSRSIGPDRRVVEANRNILLLTQQESLRQMGNRTPIVGLTANTDDGTRDEALRAGMVSVVTKPVTLHSLRKLLRVYQAALQPEVLGNAGS